MQISENYVIRKIGSNTTLIPLVRELGTEVQLYTLNSTASTILDLLQTGNTNTEILQTMKNLYPKTTEKLLKQDILNDFEAIGLLKK